MPFRTEMARDHFRILDSFTLGYVEALFFTSTGSADDGDLEDATFDDLSGVAIHRIIEDCARFQSANRVDLDEALDHGRASGYDLEKAGRDFWYSRNGHGTGFWDRDLGGVGDTLSTLATRCGSVDLYRGDDGKLYLA